MKRRQGPRQRRRQPPRHRLPPPLRMYMAIHTALRQPLPLPLPLPERQPSHRPSPPLSTLVGDTAWGLAQGGLRCSETRPHHPSRQSHPARPIRCILVSSALHLPIRLWSRQCKLRSHRRLRRLLRHYLRWASRCQQIYIVRTAWQGAACQIGAQRRCWVGRASSASAEVVIQASGAAETSWRAVMLLVETSSASSASFSSRSMGPAPSRHPRPPEATART